jgi:hypothetical protein
LPSNKFCSALQYAVAQPHCSLSSESEFLQQLQLPEPNAASDQEESLSGDIDNGRHAAAELSCLRSVVAAALHVIRVPL